MSEIVKKIEMNKRNGTFKYAIVDDDDYEWLIQYSWTERDGYALTTVKDEYGTNKILRMHRLIINAPSGISVDHINRIRHDNRKENLRLATREQNMWNVGKKRKSKSSSQYKGVYFNNGVYHVEIRFNKSRKRLGSYSNEIAAANAYNHFAKIHHGEFAVLNDVPFMNSDEFTKYKNKKTSEYTGVYYKGDRNRWATIVYDETLSRHKIIGEFKDEVIAANFYNHKTNTYTNQCEYISLEECEKARCKKEKKSKYSGVYWNRFRNKWIVDINHEGHTYRVGSFESEEDAAIAYNFRAIELNIKNLESKLNRVGEWK